MKILIFLRYDVIRTNDRYILIKEKQHDLPSNSLPSDPGGVGQHNASEFTVSITQPLTSFLREFPLL